MEMSIHTTISHSSLIHCNLIWSFQSVLFSPSPDIEINFAFVPLPVQGDERNPGVLNIPIQITLSPNIAILRDDIVASVSVLGGTATGMVIRSRTNRCLAIMYYV